MTTPRLVLFALLAAAPLLAAQDAAPSAPLFAEIVETHARPLVDAGVVPGLAVGVSIAGKREVYGLGVLSADDPRVPDGRTLYEIGSISKTFTATLLAEAQVRGELAIDDALGEHLPEGLTPPAHDGVQPVLGQLADHTSGFDALPTNFGAAPLDDPYADYDVEALWAFLDGHELSRAPGERYAYSNLAAGLLGTLTVRAAGASDYEALVRARITGPLGMTDTVVVPSDEQAARFAPPHHAGGAPSTRWHFDALAGAGALRSTVDDLLTWADAQIAPEDTPLAEAIPLTHPVRAKLPDGPASVALGWHVAGDGSTLLHSGGTNGYRTALYVNPRLRAAVVVLANSTESRVSLVAEKILQAALGGSPAPVVVRGAVTVPRDQLERLLGSYGNPFVGTFVISLDEAGRLQAKLADQPAIELFAESPTRFFYRAVDAELEFTLDEDGVPTTLTLFQNGNELPFARAP